MTAIMVDVADAITEELLRGSFSLDLSPERSYADWEDSLTDMGTLHCDVIPASSPSELWARGVLKYTVTTNVLIRRKFGPSDEMTDGRIKLEKIDELVALLQEINEFFAPSQPNQSGRELQTMPDASWKEGGIVAPYSRPMLRDCRQFSGWISLVYTIGKKPC